MKSPWRFVAGLIAGIVVALVTMATAFRLNLGTPTVGSQWGSDLIAKKRMLAAHRTTPSILVLGASGAQTGVIAQEIQIQTGWHAINLSAYLSLGTGYLLHLAQDAAKPGDTVLLVLEFELYNYGKVDQSWASETLIDYLVARDPEYLRGLSLGEQWNIFMLTSHRRLIEGLKNRRGWKPSPPVMGVYAVRNVNEWGDQTAHTRTNRPTAREPILRHRSPLAGGLSKRPAAFPIIAEFCEWARTHQVRVLASFPNLCDQPEYHQLAARETVKKIRDFYASISVPVIGDYTDSLLPADEFFDTAYHPTREAAVERTRRLAERLKPFLTNGAAIVPKSP